VAVARSAITQHVNEFSVIVNPTRRTRNSDTRSVHPPRAHTRAPAHCARRPERVCARTLYRAGPVVRTLKRRRGGGRGVRALFYDCFPLYPPSSFPSCFPPTYLPTHLPTSLPPPHPFFGFPRLGRRSRGRAYSGHAPRDGAAEYLGFNDTAPRWERDRCIPGISAR